jgi:hypothetical protein
MNTLFSRCARVLWQWRLLHKEEKAVKVEEWATELELRGTRPPRILWVQEQPQLPSVSGSLAFRSGIVSAVVLAL